jgi:hypothetical protein
MCVGDETYVFIGDKTTMDKTNNTVDFEFLISAIWLDIMRMGQSLEELDVDDVEWWRQHNKEINFAFRILAGLGLAESVVLSQDEKELEKQNQELGDEGPLETFTWTVTPSKDLMRLYGKAISKYLCERDKRLSRKFWRRF